MSMLDGQVILSDGQEEYSHTKLSWVTGKFDAICAYLGKCYLAGYKIEGSGNFHEGHYVIEDPRIGRVERRWRSTFDEA